MQRKIAGIEYLPAYGKISSRQAGEPYKLQGCFFLFDGNTIYWQV